MGSVDETWTSRAGPGETPSPEPSGSPVSSGANLPTGMKDEQRRLASTALHFAVGFAVLAPFIEWTTPGREAFDVVRLLASVATFAFAVWVTWFARTGHDLRYRRIAALGQLLLVAGAVGISFVEQWRPMPPGLSWPGLPWAGVWLLVYPFIGPAVVGGARAGLVAAAASAPVVAAVAVAVGVREMPTALGWAGVIGPTLAAATLHLFPALAVLNLSEDRTGAYRLVKRIGRGGMGEVWLATHKLLARPAAVKLIQRQSGSTTGDRTNRETEIRRFQREAAATSRLRSPHTVKLFDYGDAADGRFYYVMEHLEGLDLEQIVRRFGPVSAERAIFLVAQACLSLAEAHEHGLVHRDVKASNLFACRAGIEVDFVKVLDFGLVAAEHRSGRHTPAQSGLHTMFDGVVGTPAYMAPEVVRGGQPDPRSDVYAMGAVLFFLLTGRPVFTVPTVEAMMSAHLRTPPTAPGKQTGTDVPSDLDEIVLACLAKNPADRPPTMQALRARLLAVEVGDPWTEQRAIQWWDRQLPPAQWSQS